MVNDLPDVQASIPDVALGLNQVGITGVEKVVKFSQKDKPPFVLMAEFEVYVDLPRERKGVDMSRNMEVINETLEAVIRDPAFRVEGICGAIADRLLEKHEYTTTATVEMEAEYMTHDETPISQQSTQGSVTMIASATAHKNASTAQEIGVRATGMTVCPCSQEMMSATARAKLRDLGVGKEEIRTFLREVPQAGHSQRGQATVTVRTEGHPDVDLYDLMAIARDAMSARIYNLAKRPDEDHMTYEAHANARFVEDCVRTMAEQIVETYPGLSDDAVITMRQSNSESIHQHNAHAERIATLSELRAEIGDVAE